MAHRVIMPRLSQDMTQGRIVEWLKRTGESVAEGEPLLTVETDKAEVEVPAPGSGTLRRILVEVGEEVNVGTSLAIVGELDETLDATDEMANDLPSELSDRVETEMGGAPVGIRGQDRSASIGHDVEVTGPDVRPAQIEVASVAADFGALGAAATPSNVDVVPLSAVRRRIAERLAESRQTAADVTTVTDVDMSYIATLRKTSGLSYTAYVTWATARALREFPILNSSLVGSEIWVKRDIHLGVAVALDQALVVPVVHFADRKSVEEIAREIDELADRAKEGRLRPDELTGSTFTVTNSGAFGSLFFTPIINQPEVGIIGAGKVADTPVVQHGEIVVRKVMYLCLTYDHRVVDGAPAVQFLQAVRRRLEQPEAPVG